MYSSGLELGTASIRKVIHKENFQAVLLTAICCNILPLSILIPFTVMHRSDFNYELPEDLIAQYPPEKRGDSRLLYLDAVSGVISDHGFTDLISLINPEDMLVFNDTRVIPARLYGVKETGGRVEILVERITGDQEILAQIRASKSPVEGCRIFLENQQTLQVTGRQGEFFKVRSEANDSLPGILDAIGHIPLPPYIKRDDQQLDRDRYQTVYARHAGAVAAPTAGLHFSDTMLEKIQARGCETGFVTLHVGAGTFQPVRVENIKDHRMHSEYFAIDEQLCEGVNRVRRRGGRIIAVGTTTVRALESSVAGGALQPGRAETDIFIVPGFRFQLVDAMLTNFHLPESTLLMLVCAFAGKEKVLQAYNHAVKEKYRFFSYGDAMFINKATSYKQQATRN